MTHTTSSLLAINTAIRAAHGDYYATVRSTARFMTEALVDAAIAAVDGMTGAERSKFVSSWPSYRAPSRDEAICALCGWVSCMRIREFGAMMDAARAAATAEFPAAIEMLGAAL